MKDPLHEEIELDQQSMEITVSKSQSSLGALVPARVVPFTEAKIFITPTLLHAPHSWRAGSFCYAGANLLNSLNY
jgi:hypothetical protein